MIKRLFLLFGILICGAIFLISFWFNKELSDLSAETILFHIFLPSKGSLSVCNNISQLLILLLFFVLLVGVYHYFMGIRYFKFQFIFMGLLFCYDCYYIENNFHIWSYYKDIHQNTSFIRENYVSPLDKNLSFPSKKRNLIIIQVESLENTFQDKPNGGYFNENYIKEITALTKEHVNFTGMKMLPGTTWTMAAVIAMNAGVPLKNWILHKDHPLRNQGSTSKRKYFSEITTLNDILEENGYTNLFLLGTDPIYAGQGDFFEQHGKSKVISLYKGKNAYDSDIYRYIEENIQNIQKPFFLFIQTYDSHFEGRLNPICTNNYSEKILNVYSCVSKHLSDFIHYLQKQPFYQNTTIVVVGDHPNMSKKVCELISCTDYLRSPIVIFMNLPFPFTGKINRDFSTFDLFPTILSSIGVKINNNVLGLGVNLFSGRQTLIEKYGYKQVSDSLKKNDNFYNAHFLMGI